LRLLAPGPGQKTETTSLVVGDMAPWGASGSNSQSYSYLVGDTQISALYSVRSAVFSSSNNQETPQ